MGNIFGELWRYYNQGGPVMYLITACAIFALYVIIYKMIVFFRLRIDTNEFVTKQFEDTLSEGRAKLIPEVSNLNRFWRLLGPFMIRRLKDEMVELKEKHRQIMILPMDDEHRQMYDEYEQWATETIRKAMNNGEGQKRSIWVSSAVPSGNSVSRPPCQRHPTI